MKNLFKGRRKWLMLLLLPLFALSLAACNSSSGQSSGNQKESAQQQADTNSLENNQPLPHFNYSQERQNMIDIERAQADNVETTTFWMNMGDSDPIGSCPSIGFGIPDTASLSNPLQAQWVGGGNGNAGITTGQMDPTGIYSPTGSMGTYIICLASNGQPYIDRVESTVDTYGGPAVWNYTKHMGELVGAPTAAANISAHNAQHGKDLNKAKQVAGK